MKSLNSRTTSTVSNSESNKIHIDKSQKSLSRNWTKKAIFTLNIDNYAPEITKLTRPFLERYAKKINAELIVIKKRKFPNYPITYEKFQIYELGKNNDWNIYIDSDCLVHPDLFDITETIPEDTVLNYNADFANNRYKYDNYFRRDGRNIGSINFLTVSSHDCHEIWEPLNDLTLNQAIGYIKAIPSEEAIKRNPSFRIDNFVISRNIAEYSIKFKTFTELLRETGRETFDYLCHESAISEEKKIEKIKQKLKDWEFV